MEFQNFTNTSSVAEKVIKDEIALYQSYNDSLKKVLKIEEELQSLRKKSASVISNLKNDDVCNLPAKSFYIKKQSTSGVVNITSDSKPHFKTLIQNNTRYSYIDADSSDNKKIFSTEHEMRVSFNNNNLYLNRYSASMKEPQMDKRLKIVKSKRPDDKPNDFSYHEVEELYKSFREYHPVSLAKQLNKVYHDLVNQHTKDEELLSKYFDIALNIREKAVIKSAKCELMRLKIKDSNAFQQLLSLKRKQRGLLIKLQHEYNEIKLMKKFQRKLFDDRKRVLLKQLKHFTTIISGSSESGSKIRDNINLKSTICAEDNSKKFPVKCYSTALRSEHKHDINKRCSVLMNHKRTLNNLLLLHFDLQLNKIALDLIDKNNSGTEIVNVLKQLSQKSPVHLDREQTFKNPIIPITFNSAENEQRERREHTNRALLLLVKNHRFSRDKFKRKPYCVSYGKHSPSDCKIMDLLHPREFLSGIFSSNSALSKGICNNNAMNFYMRTIGDHVKAALKRFFILLEYFLKTKRYKISMEFPIFNFAEMMNNLKYNEENYSVIRIQNFSLSFFTEIIGNIEQMFIEKQRLKRAADTKINATSSHFSDTRRKCIFLSISTKENYSLETINLQCFISENRPVCGEFHDYIHMKRVRESQDQIWDIDHMTDVPYPCEDSAMTSNRCENAEQTHQKLIVKSNKNKSALTKHLTELTQIRDKRKCDVDASEQIGNGKIPLYVAPRTINQLEEAEELRKKQLAVEMEIKALLEQQSSQVPYFLVREIPDKPPPPYIPPEDKTQDLLSNSAFFKNGIVEKNRQTINIIDYCYENVWSVFMVKTCTGECDPSEIIGKHKKLNLNNRFLFDLCNELFCYKYKSINKKVMPWQYKKLYTHTKGDICKSVETAAMQSLGFGNRPLKDNIFINCAHKLQDHVDELLIRELQEEEVEWINIEEYEMNIKNTLTDKILGDLLDETVTEYLKIIRNQ